jgi:hypothetical protein
MLPIAAFLTIYMPDAGHGFIKDDFGWILNSRLSAFRDINRILTFSDGFYRPVVSLSFALNYALAGLNAKMYGLTNVFLALGCAGALYLLARSLTLPPRVALTAAGLWAFNFHGINMTVLWISGRTSLLATFFAVVATAAFVKERWFAAALLILASLLSKEESIVLPLILLIWTISRSRALERHSPAPRSWIPVCVALVLPTVAYAVLRFQTSAMLPHTAPWYYRFTFVPTVVLENALQYADRAATLPVAVSLLVWAIIRVRPQLAIQESTTALLGVAWLVLGYALTVFLPVRSSLYACFPSIGAALAGAVVTGNLVQRAPEIIRKRLAIGALVLPFALWPVYHARNCRWVSLGGFSTSILKDLTEASQPLPEHQTIVVVDDRSKRANISSAFGNFLPEALLLSAGKRFDVVVEPPLPDEEMRPVPSRTVTLHVVDGRLIAQ